MITFKVCFKKRITLDFLRIVFLRGENNFQICIKYQYCCDALEEKTNQNCFLVLIERYHQEQQHCLHKFLMVEFRLMFELW